MYIKRDDARQPSLTFERPTKKRFDRRDIPHGVDQKIHGLSLFIDGSVKIGPADFDLDVVLVDAPGGAGLQTFKSPTLRRPNVSAN
jgi:hypothetical protein